MPSVCAAKRLTVPATYPGPVAVQLRAVAGIVSTPGAKVVGGDNREPDGAAGVERALTTIVSGPDDAGTSGTVSGSASGKVTVLLERENLAKPAKFALNVAVAVCALAGAALTTATRRLRARRRKRADIPDSACPAGMPGRTRVLEYRLGSAERVVQGRPVGAGRIRPAVVERVALRAGACRTRERDDGLPAERLLVPVAAKFVPVEVHFRALMRSSCRPVERGCRRPEQSGSPRRRRWCAPSR